MRRNLTDAGARGSGAGAANTRPASKPRASRGVRPVRWDISLAGVLPVPWVRIYMNPTCTDHSAARYYTRVAVDLASSDRLPGYGPNSLFTSRSRRGLPASAQRQMMNPGRSARFTPSTARRTANRT